MKELDIVLINMSSYSEWESGVSNRNYHVVRELEKNPQVKKIMCVDYPPLNFKRALRNYKENILVGLDKGTLVKKSPLGNVRKISDRLFVYSYVDYFLNKKGFVKRLNSVLKELEFENTIVWSFFPPIMKDLESLKSSLLVFDAVDNWAEHSSYKKYRKNILDQYDYVKKEADVIFTVSEDLKNLFDDQSNVYWIPNGVDLKHYQEDWKLVNRDIGDLPRPIIGYIGVIQDRVDISLVHFLAEKNPKKTFVLIGPVWYEKSIKELGDLPNVHLLGYKEYKEAPMYIQQFDVGIIPHKEVEFITSTNPMKMYEYLATGKPVVATEHSGAEMFKDMVYIAKDKESFNDKLQLALKENSPEAIANRKVAMEKHSWTKTVKEMLALIEKKLNY